MAKKEAVVDTLSWEGTLSSSDFRVAASAFMEKWKRICSAFPPWSWVLCPKQPWVASHEVEGYLSLENILLKSSEEELDEPSCLGNEETCSSEEEEPIDNATLEHPYLNRPWYKLHPCGTSEWMKLLFHADPAFAKTGLAIELYLVAWLSVVGQVAGLRIPFEMMKQL
uniref:Ubiquitin-like-conjugating enzyme ATG10 n=1 Tax=Fagus sylvatica TaxID=28930 RepID=A0A2N9F8V7_FAGSY